MSAFLDETGVLITVDHSNPLPVALVNGFTSLKIVRAPAITTSSSGTPYAAGDNIGGVIQLDDVLNTSINKGILSYISLSAKWTNTVTLQVRLFDSALSGSSTVTDNSPLSIAAADAAKEVWTGVLTIAATTTTGDVRTTYNASDLNIPVQSAGSGRLYLVLSVESALTTTSTSDICNVTVATV